MKKHLLPTVMVLLSSAFWQTSFAQTDFYKTEAVQSINITFTASNWRYILDSLRYNGEGMLKGTVNINGTALPGAGIRYRDARAFVPGAKRNGLYIQLNHTSPSQNYASHKAVDLSPSLRDPSMLREVLGYEIARSYMPAPGANYAKVTINGEFYGLLINVEVVDDAFLAKHFGDSRGSLFLSDPNTSENPPGSCRTKIYGSLQHESEEACLAHRFKKIKGDWQDLVQMTQVLNENAKEVDRVLHVDHTLHMLAFNNAIVNLSSYTGQYSPNYYLYKDAKGRMTPILHNLNLAFGSYKNTGYGSDLSGTELLQLDPMLHAGDNMMPLVSQLLGDDQYKKTYLAHIRAIMIDHMADNKLAKRAEELRRLVADAVKMDVNRGYTLEEYERSLKETIGSRSLIPGILDFVAKRHSFLEAHPALTVAPPDIAEVSVLRRERLSTQQVTNFTVRVKVDQYTKRVRLLYRFDSKSDFTEATLYDDGQHGDEAAGDNTYGVVIEPSGNSQMEYYIYAENARTAAFSPANYVQKRHKASLAELNR